MTQPASNFICVPIPSSPAPQAITLPGGAAMQGQANDLLNMIQPALAPFVPIFDVIDTVLAVFAVVKAIPDALGPPPNPSKLAGTIGELGKKVSKLLRLVPQLSLPYTLVGVLDLLLVTLGKARDDLRYLQARMVAIERAADRATELGDAVLASIVACARMNAAQEAANVGRALASLAKLIALANVFMGMIGGSQIPDLSTLSGTPLNAILVPLDAIVATLRTVRKAIPLP